MDPLAQFTPEQGRGPEEPCTARSCAATARPGVHAWDRSYWQLYLSFRGLNVSLEWTGTSAGGGYDTDQRLSILATVVAGGGSGAVAVNSSDFELAITGDFKFDRVGTAKLLPGKAGLLLRAYGLRNTTARALTTVGTSGESLLLPAASTTNSGSTAMNQTMYLALKHGVAALTTAEATVVPSLAALQAQVAHAGALATFRLPPPPPATPSTTTAESSVLRSSQLNTTAELIEAGEAMQAGLMWNVLWHPTQAGPFISVSRSFTLHPYRYTAQSTGLCYVRLFLLLTSHWFDQCIIVYPMTFFFACEYAISLCHTQTSRWIDSWDKYCGSGMKSSNGTPTLGPSRCLLMQLLGCHLRSLRSYR